MKEYATLEELANELSEILQPKWWRVATLWRWKRRQQPAHLLAAFAKDLALEVGVLRRDELWRRAYGPWLGEWR